jgi:galactokinase
MTQNARPMDADGQPRAGAAVAALRQLTGRAPDALWAAPGRITLIGEHTDYQEGLVLPVAVDRSAVVALGRRDDGIARCRSLQLEGDVSLPVAEIEPRAAAGWASPLLGVLWALRRAGLEVAGVDVVVDSDVPIGGGMASSAALAVATALGVAQLSGAALTPIEVARRCQEGENAIAAAPTGIMDQLAVLQGRAGHAVLLDCRTLDTELVPLDLAGNSLVLLVIDTGVRHTNSDAGYRSRRAQSSEAAAALGLPSLRDALGAQVDAQLDGVLQRRARHVVSENARVLRVADLLHAGRLTDIGPVLDESHASLRDDYEVSCAELDLAAAAAVGAGALGSRMTGAGFGGCAIALTPADRVDEVAGAVRTAFAQRGLRTPAVFPVSSADGAARLA